MKKPAKPPVISRRRFINTTLTGIAALPFVNMDSLYGKNDPVKTAQIALIKTGNRKEAVHELLKMTEFKPPKGKKVFIKPNFNTADPCPGSTHNHVLSQLVTDLKEHGARSITVGDRSGPQPTKEVLEKKGINKLAKELDFAVSNFSELEDKDWIQFAPKGIHWENGFLLARPAVESEYLVMTHCLKTHQYGGVFTLSLKLTVGIAPRKLMRQLHRSPDMRKMIAELNIPIKPELLVMDGVEAFVDGGPMTGTKKTANVLLAGTDRVAMDAVGVAILKELGSNDKIMNSKIFEQEQIKRAAELNLGISHHDQIKIVTNDTASKEYAKKIYELLHQG